MKQQVIMIPGKSIGKNFIEWSMVKAPVTVNAWNTIKGYTRRALGFEPLPLLLLTNNRE
jgi:hypothetical protein